MDIAKLNEKLRANDVLHAKTAAEHERLRAEKELLATRMAGAHKARQDRRAKHAAGRDLEANAERQRAEVAAHLEKLLQK